MVHPFEAEGHSSGEPTTLGGLVSAATLADVEQSLRQSGYGELQFVRCVMDGGNVTLQGIVSSFHMKQVAQIMARRIAGVRTVKNEITVSR